MVMYTFPVTHVAYERDWRSVPTLEVSTHDAHSWPQLRADAYATAELGNAYGNGRPAAAAALDRAVAERMYMQYRTSVSSCS